MSTNSEEKGSGSGGGAAAGLQAVPRLRGGTQGYAAWKPNMEAHLQRAGAKGIHTTVHTAAQFGDYSSRVLAWEMQELQEAIDATAPDGPPTVPSTPTLKGDAGASSSTAQSTERSEKEKSARRTVSLMVQLSNRVYGILYSALPEELKPQVEHLQQGWAYGLWHWLETKFQSTEADSVNGLIGQWGKLQQEEEEPFDAYRARVNSVRLLLDRSMRARTTYLRRTSVCESARCTCVWDNGREVSRGGALLRGGALGGGHAHSASSAAHTASEKIRNTHTRRCTHVAM